jgi:hypothetical protein
MHTHTHTHTHTHREQFMLLNWKWGRGRGGALCFWTGNKLESWFEIQAVGSRLCPEQPFLPMLHLNWPSSWVCVGAGEGNGFL